MLSWTNSKRKLKDLIPWEDNPRQISKAHAKKLEEGLGKFGQVQTIAIGPDETIYDGHQRTAVWSLAEKYGPDYEVDVRIASRPLTEAEQRELVILLHAGASGSWDWEKIANEWEIEDLQEWGFDENTFRNWKTDAGALGNLLESQDADEMWEGMPEFEQEDKTSYRRIIVHFMNEQDITDFAELVEQNITDKTKYLYYPKQERVSYGLVQ